MKLNQEQIDKFFKEADVDGNNEISWREFMLSTNITRLLDDDTLKEYFYFFASEDTGVIDYESMKEKVPNLREEDWNATLQDEEAPVIDFESFVRIIRE